MTPPQRAAAPVGTASPGSFLEVGRLCGSKSCPSASRRRRHRSLRLHRLVALDLSESRSLTDVGIGHVSVLSKTLRHLDLTDCSDLTDVSLSTFTALHQLHHLILRSCWQIRATSDEVHFRALSNLRSLNLYCCGAITDASLQLFAPCHNLEELELCACTRLTDVALEYIVRFLPKLHTLSLSGCSRLTDEGMALLSAGASQGSSLTSLDISYLEITDKSLEFVGTLCQLKRLDLEHNAKITDDGVQQLSSLVSLTHLNFSSCSKVTMLGCQSRLLTMLKRIPEMKCDPKVKLELKKRVAELRLRRGQRNK